MSSEIYKTKMMIVEERMNLLKKKNFDVSTDAVDGAKLTLTNLDIYNMKISQIDDHIRQIKMR